MGELVKPTFSPLDWGVFNVFFKAKFIGTAKTEIKANASYNGVKAFCYLASFHHSSGDNTGYEHGIVRLGHDGGYVTKYDISSTTNSQISFKASDDGFVEITSGGNLYTIILCWG